MHQQQEREILRTRLPARSVFPAIIAALLVFLASSAHASSDLYVSTTGSVGVGTTAPDQSLTVAGAIHSTTSGFELPGGSFISAISGNTATAATTTGTFTSGDLATWDSHGNLQDGGSPSSLGGMTLLATVNASGASSVTFGSSYITSTYNKYVIEFDSVIPATAATQLELQVSANNGSTWKTSGYSWQATFASLAALNVSHGTSTAAADGDSSASAISITGTNTAQTLVIFPGSPPPVSMSNVDLTMAATSTDLASGTIKFSLPSGSNITNFVYDADFPANNGGATLYFARANGSGEYLTAGSINAIKIFMSSGNITGNFHLYGLSGT